MSPGRSWPRKQPLTCWYTKWLTAAGRLRQVLGMSELSEPVTTGCHGAPGAVIGTPDEKWGELVTALIVASDPALTEEELIAHCRTRLAGYSAPSGSSSWTASP